MTFAFMLSLIERVANRILIDVKLLQPFTKKSLPNLMIDLEEIFCFVNLADRDFCFFRSSTKVKILTISIGRVIIILNSRYSKVK